jgi:hypothetical protein
LNPDHKVKFSFSIKSQIFALKMTLSRGGDVVAAEQQCLVEKLPPDRQRLTKNADKSALRKEQWVLR